MVHFGNWYIRCLNCLEVLFNWMAFPLLVEHLCFLADNLHTRVSWWILNMCWCVFEWLSVFLSLSWPHNRKVPPMASVGWCKLFHPFMRVKVRLNWWQGCWAVNDPTWWRQRHLVEGLNFYLVKTCLWIGDMGRRVRMVPPCWWHQRHLVDSSVKMVCWVLTRVRGGDRAYQYYVHFASVFHI